MPPDAPVINTVLPVKSNIAVPFLTFVFPCRPFGAALSP
jgi:hypothetical protein